MSGKTCILSVFIFISIISTVICIIKETQSYATAKLKYCNPKFFSYCYIITTANIVDGVERFFTNHTFTNIVTLGNNLTASGVLHNPKGIQYTVQHKFCDYFKQFWLQTFLKTFAHTTLPCPAPPRTTYLNNLELPPPNAPIPLLSGTYLLESEIYVTVSKERLVRIHYTIHFSETYKSKRKNTNKNKKG